MLDVLVPSVATAVAAWFAFVLARRYVTRGRRSTALRSWTVSFALFAAASAALAVGAAAGWSPAVFRTYYLAGGVLVVPWLALGSVEVAGRDPLVLRVLGVTALVLGVLLAVPASLVEDPLLFTPAAVGALGVGMFLLPAEPEGGAMLCRWLVAMFTVVAALVVLTAPLQGPVPLDTLPESKELFAPIVRSLAIGGNAVGATIVVVGAVASALRLRGKGLPHLVQGNLLIGGGALVAGSGGSYAFLGDTASHGLAFTAGVILMYAGFVRTTRPVTSVGAPDGQRSPGPDAVETTAHGATP